MHVGTQQYTTSDRDLEYQTAFISATPTNRSIAFAPIAGSAVRSPFTSRTIKFFMSRAATARPMKTACASRAASGLIIRATPTG